MFAGAVVTAAGLGTNMLYFDHPYFWVFVGSKVATSFGMGLLTTAAVFLVSSGGERKAHLSLYVALAIIVGTEVGLEVFEALITLLELMQVTSDTIYSLIFVSQCAFVVLALLFIPATIMNRTDSDDPSGFRPVPCSAEPVAPPQESRQFACSKGGI